MPAEIPGTIEHLVADISEWVESAIERGNPTPDFWDELSTSERLAEWLHDRGWRKEA